MNDPWFISNLLKLESFYRKCMRFFFLLIYVPNFLLLEPTLVLRTFWSIQVTGSINIKKCLPKLPIILLTVGFMKIFEYNSEYVRVNELSLGTLLRKFFCNYSDYGSYVYCFVEKAILSNSFLSGIKKWLLIRSFYI